MKISLIIVVVSTVFTFILKIAQYKILGDITGAISLIFWFRFLFLFFKGYFLNKYQTKK